jgi:FkbM family methyltransferase
MKRIIKNILGSLGYTLVKNDSLIIYKNAIHSLDDINFLSSLSEHELIKAVPLLKKSRAQLRQDIFVLFENNMKCNGFFVEFGATDGVQLSNTHMLEKEFSWKGILAEPGRMWHEALIRNRSSKIDFSCVWRETGLELSFVETEIPELSTVKALADRDYHSNSRIIDNEYTVMTKSLHDLLDEYDAPKQIDYLSIDTEGSEFGILNAFDFDKYDIKVITCEHNYSDDREKIFNLLTSNGYRRVRENISKFDDWYVKQ